MNAYKIADEAQADIAGDQRLIAWRKHMRSCSERHSAPGTRILREDVTAQEALTLLRAALETHPATRVDAVRAVDEAASLEIVVSGYEGLKDIVAAVHQTNLQPRVAASIDIEIVPEACALGDDAQIALRLILTSEFTGDIPALSDLVLAGEYMGLALAWCVSPTFAELAIRDYE